MVIDIKFIVRNMNLIILIIKIRLLIINYLYLINYTILNTLYLINTLIIQILYKILYFLKLIN